MAVFVAAVVAVAGLSARAAEAAQVTELEGGRGVSLLSNGGFESAEAGGAWVADWPKAEGVTWEREPEGGGRFLRFTQVTPGKRLTLYRAAEIPAGTAALRLSFRVRYERVVAGEKPWFDATVIVNFMDALNGGKQVKPVPAPAHFHGTSKGWIDYAAVLPVPAGAKAVELMPGFFNAAGGTMDLDDVVLWVATDDEVAQWQAKVEAAKPLPVPATETARREKWPEELVVAGNQLRTKRGEPVWLQGVVIPSLEWSATGENALASIKVAIEEWHGNILRLEVRDDFWNGTAPGQADGGAGYRALVDAAVTFAANRGVYTMLDLHRYRAVRPEHVGFWKEAATIYMNHPAVLFDLFNEPHGISWEVWRNGGFVEEKTKAGDEDAFLSESERKKSDRSFQSPGMQALVDAVRGVGARNVVVAGGGGWAYDLSGVTRGYALTDKTGNGVMYSWHVYNWHTGWEAAVLAAAEKYPILVGECGADVRKMGFIPAEQQEDPRTWSPRFIGFVQKHRLNWTAFSFHPQATPVLITDWKFTPSVGWGENVKAALAGKRFEYEGMK